MMRRWRALQPLVRDDPGERGSVSVWMATALFVMVIMVGLAVDLGGRVYAMQRAQTVAAQAARAGGQQLVPAEAIRGQRPRADPGPATAAAQDYLAAAGVPGQVGLQTADTIVVSVTDTYTTKFLGIIGIDQLSVTGHAESRMVRAREGVEQ